MEPPRSKNTDVQKPTMPPAPMLRFL